ISSDKSDPDKFLDRMKASGEDNNAKLIAAYFKFKGLNANYINPKDAGLLVTDEHASAQVLPESYDRLFALREREG
ncbi:aspartate kinase, partial [Escherichia coli]|nr:aspartate kinase [Escherichia coli]